MDRSPRRSRRRRRRGDRHRHRTPSCRASSRRRRTLRPCRSRRRRQRHRSNPRRLCRAPMTECRSPVSSPGAQARTHEWHRGRRRVLRPAPSPPLLRARIVPAWGCHRRRLGSGELPVGLGVQAGLVFELVQVVLGRRVAAVVRLDLVVQLLEPPIVSRRLLRFRAPSTAACCSLARSTSRARRLYSALSAVSSAVRERRRRWLPWPPLASRSSAVPAPACAASPDALARSVAPRRRGRQRPWRWRVVPARAPIPLDA